MLIPFAAAIHNKLCDNLLFLLAVYFHARRKTPLYLSATSEKKSYCYADREAVVRNMVDKEEVTINPLKLFLRLAFARERKPETLMDKYFGYEVTN